MGWTYRMGASTLEEFLKVPEREWISSFGDASGEPFVFLSTCNRIEFYFICNGPDDGRFSFLNGRLKKLTGQEAIDHLFRVACGLDSLSVGEGEVLGQVKRAFADYLKRGVKDHLINEVFNAAIRAGKAVRERTGISTGKVSVPSVFTEMLKSQISLPDARILVIGTGRMGMGFVRQISQAGASNIGLVYRNTRPTGSVINVKEYHISELPSILKNYNVIIAATTSKDPIIFPEMFDGFERTYIVDVSNPANVHQSVRFSKNIVYMDLSDLERYVSDHLGERSESIKAAEEMMLAEEEKLKRKLENHEIEEFMKDFYSSAMELAYMELDKFRKEKGKKADTDALLSKMMDSYTKKLMHPVTRVIREIINRDSRALEEIRALRLKALNRSRQSHGRDRQDIRSQQGQTHQ